MLTLEKVEPMRLTNAEEEVQAAIETDTLRNEWALAFTFEDSEDGVRRTFYAARRRGGIRLEDDGYLTFGETDVRLATEDEFLPAMLLELFENVAADNLGAWGPCYAA